MHSLFLLRPFAGRETHLLRRSTRIEVRLKDFLRKVFQVYAEGLSNGSDGGHPHNPAASLLVGIFLSVNTYAVDQIHRIYRLVESNK